MASMVEHVTITAPDISCGHCVATIKEAVCKGTVSFLQREARKPGSYFWLKGGKRRQKVAAAEPVRP